MNPKIIILLPVHNRREITRKFLECLNQQTYKNWHLILIDDGCTDGTAEMSESLIKNITILKGSGNLWWAGALQMAYNYLKTTKVFNHNDIVLIINDDVFIEKEFLSYAVDVFNKNKNERILMQAIPIEKKSGFVYQAGDIYDKKKLKFTPSNNSKEINCLSTRGLFLGFRDFLTSGGFYPKKLPHYLSDCEFTYRLIEKQSFIPLVDERVRVWCMSDISGFDSSKHNQPIKVYFKTLFSEKNMSNPLHWINFVFLTCDFPYNILNSLRVFKMFVRNTIVIFINGLRKLFNSLSKR